MTGCPFLTVVIPVHNRAHLLGRAIRSVQAQTFEDLELLVVDDGSTDRSAEAAAEVEDPRIRVIRLPCRSGVSRARNTGILEARGNLVAFLDSDDEWLPRKLERQVAWLRGHPAPPHILVSCRYIRHDDVTHRVAAPSRPIATGNPFDQIVAGRAPLPSCVVMPRAAVGVVAGLDEGLPAFADYELWLRLAAAGTRFVELDDALVIKHDHGARQISSDPDVMLRAFRTLDQKWGERIRHGSGLPRYRRWRARFLASIQYVRVRQAVSQGDRLRAWQEWVHMCRHLPWSRRYAVYGLGLAMLGLHAYDAAARARDTLTRWLGPR
jgi:glycosyltransferase involved in cell wall biosynthesis